MEGFFYSFLNGSIMPGVGNRSMQASKRFSFMFYESGTGKMINDLIRIKIRKNYDDN